MSLPQDVMDWFTLWIVWSHHALEDAVCAVKRVKWDSWAEGYPCKQCPGRTERQSCLQGAGAVGSPGQDEGVDQGQDPSRWSSSSREVEAVGKVAATVQGRAQATIAMGWTADRGSWYICSGQLKPIYTQGPDSLQCADLCGCVLSSLFLPAVSSLIFSLCWCYLESSLLPRLCKNGKCFHR